MTNFKKFLNTFFHKKIVIVAFTLVLAIVTGYAVGRLYVQSLDPVLLINQTEEEVREKPDDVEKLVAKAQSGAKPTSFDAMQLYLIAEYNLNHAQSFYKVMTGDVNASVVEQKMRAEKLKAGNIYVYNKLSPSSMSLSRICSQTIYNSQTGEIKINRNGTFTRENGTDIAADFRTEDFAQYTLEEYKQALNTTPDNVLPYIISGTTCSQKKFTPVKNNQDGTYSFSIAIDGNMLALAAMCYSYEIKFSTSLTDPPKWISMSMDVVIDQNFNFVSIHYLEAYKMSYMGVKPTVNDNFTDVFYFDEVDIPTPQQVAGREVL